MASVGRSGNRNLNERDSYDSGTPSNNLWIGNVTAEISEADLMELFSKHGAVDNVTVYQSRNFAFIHFKQIGDAKAAKQALQGTNLCGSSLKIEFARPAKPCKSLWVSGISSAATQEILEGEFRQHGEIKEFKLTGERNTAYVEYFRLEDASKALKNMNGKRIGGGQIRVDYSRSNASKRDQCGNSRGPREGHFPSRSIAPHESPQMREASGSFMQSGVNRHQQYVQSSGSRAGDMQPSNKLWINYPPDMHVDEQRLHNAMILFGEIEKIRSFPAKNCSLVEFRSVEEARRAKEGLEGRLFGDPRINLSYLCGDVGYGKNLSGFHPGGLQLEGPKAGTFFHEPPKHRANLDAFRHSMGSSISIPPPSTGIIRPITSVKPFVPQVIFEPHLSFPELGDVNHKLPDSYNNSWLGVPRWRQSSAAPGMLPLSSPGVKRPAQSMSGPGDVYASNSQSDSKRSRTDIGFPTYETSPPAQEMHYRGSEQLYRLGPEINGESLGTVSNVQGRHTFNPTEVRTTGGQRHTKHDYIWRGVISKGGSPVCRARCVPFGDTINFAIPHEVNCSSRTGLDLLTKHYADAVGSQTVFFLPDSEEDFASYTEFLQFLATRNRAGVAKFEDGTTLFVVPPSDFLYKVLGVAVPARLYGVVLKFPQHAPDSALMQPESQPRYADRQHISSQDVMPQKEKFFQGDCSRVLSEYPLPPMKQFAQQSSSESLSLPAASVSNAVTSQGGLTLTPEIIASLASSLLPAAAKFSGVETLQQPLESSSTRPSLPPSADSDRALMPQTWVHDQTAVNSELPYQAQQHQPATFGADEETIEAAADKDQRYKSTLHFAANLLRQIQEQQQHQGSGSR